MFRPLRNDILVEMLDPEFKSKLVIPPKHMSRLTPYTRARVLALGPHVKEDIQINDVIWIEGQRSGFKVNTLDLHDNTYVVNEEICIAKEEKE